MTTLYKRFGSFVKGVLSGFDRIVFKGSIRPLMYEESVVGFLRRRKILNKDYKSWMRVQSNRIAEDAESLVHEECGGKVEPILYSKTKKEGLARRRQEALSLTEGLIGIWSATELCNSYRAFFAKGQSRPVIRRNKTKCKHLYYYLDHQDYGLMHIRLQTWFPFNIQVAMNGREWLRRGLEREGIGFDVHQNKFLHIDDMNQAQRLLDAQLDVNWPDLLNGFLPIAFPSMTSILGPDLSYYWTLWQSEWATDHLFASPQALSSVASQLLQHALVTGTYERVLRYMDRPFTKAGEPYASNRNDVSSRPLIYQDGVRVKHWVDTNSVKAYTEQNNLRVETTMNAPGMFKVYRHKEGDPEDAPKERRPMRKGVADIPLRAKISQQINDKVIKQLDTCQMETPLEETFEGICRRMICKGRAYRALAPIGKDRELLLAIGDPAFAVSGITNRKLRQNLKFTVAGLSQKQAAAKLSRLLRLLRQHGLIAKYPKQRRYRLTVRGMKITTSLAVALHSSTKRLMEIAA